MARVLLSEADPDVRSLLELVLRRLGHDPTPLVGELPSDPPHGDVLIFEPACPVCLRHASVLRRLRPALPLVALSILPPSSSVRELAPAVHLVKPFGRQQLAGAIASVLPTA